MRGIQIAVLAALAARAGAQVPMPGMNMPPRQPAANAGAFLMGEASGTSVNPASYHPPMIHRMRGGWMFMLHGQAFLDDAQQSGPRGGDKLFSVNWAMASAQHKAGAGAVTFRVMLSLEPATITERRYPELFQTGETAYGLPLVDAQHPHDFFMEVSAQYARPLGHDTLLELYAAPVGDPALGPVAFPHRASAEEIPQAPLSHHLQDSTHISDDVVTAGLKHGMFRLEASGFHGGEPGEFRWDIDSGAMDSWSTRLWITPGANWAGQVSIGRLRHPEALEPGDQQRATASLSYHKPLAAGAWTSSLIWGRVRKTALGRVLNSYLAESTLQFGRKNFLDGRFELVDKDELLETAGLFRIAAYTVGYTRDFELVSWMETGVGANFSAYGVPDALHVYYGAHPVGAQIFLRVRPR